VVFKDNVWTKASEDTAQDFAGLFDDAGEGQGNDDPAQAVMDRMVHREPQARERFPATCGNRQAERAPGARGGLTTGIQHLVAEKVH
jgi:hypothetical protein